MDADTFAKIRELFAGMIPFNKVLGLEITQLEAGRARLRMPFREELVGDPFRPALHGGTISAMLDTAGGLAVWSRLTLSDRVSTVDLRVDYLLPGRLLDVHAEAKVRRLGNRMAVVAVRAWHEDAPDDAIAEAMAVYNVRRARDRVARDEPEGGGGHRA